MHLFAKQLLIVGASSTLAVYLQIPWVNSVVESMTREFSPAIHYDGLRNHANLIPETPSSQNVIQVAQPLGKQEPPDGPPEDGPDMPPPTPPYWFEHIKHQGVAAFNSDSSGYQVYRNVKDFGAKGISR